MKITMGHFDGKDIKGKIFDVKKYKICHIIKNDEDIFFARTRFNYKSAYCCFLRQLVQHKCRFELIRAVSGTCYIKMHTNTKGCYHKIRFSNHSRAYTRENPKLILKSGFRLDKNNNLEIDIWDSKSYKYFKEYIYTDLFI